MPTGLALLLYADDTVFVSAFLLACGRLMVAGHQTGRPQLIAVAITVPRPSKVHTLATPGTETAHAACRRLALLSLATAYALRAAHGLQAFPARRLGRSCSGGLLLQRGGLCRPLLLRHLARLAQLHLRTHRTRMYNKTVLPGSTA